MPEAMRQIMVQTSGFDRGQFEKGCRQWLKKDPKGFMSKLAELEIGKEEANAPAPEDEVNESEGRARELIGNLVEEAGDGLVQGNKA